MNMNLYLIKKMFVNGLNKMCTYYWICVKICGATFRTIFKNNDHIKDESCILMDHLHTPNTIKINAK